MFSVIGFGWVVLRCKIVSCRFLSLEGGEGVVWGEMAN